MLAPRLLERTRRGQFSAGADDTVLMRILVPRIRSQFLHRHRTSVAARADRVSRMEGTLPSPSGSELGLPARSARAASLANQPSFG